MLVSKYISEQKLLPVIKRSFYDYKRESINQDNIILNVAAAAKPLQSCLTLCDPIDSSPTSGILQVRTPEWVAISFSSA